MSGGRVLRMTVIGAGRAGAAVAGALRATAAVEIASVVNRSTASATRAVTSIGGGHAARWSELESADLYLIGVPDDAIVDVTERLVRVLGARATPGIVFHLSGAARSSVLGAARAIGLRLASVHPVRSYAAAVPPGEGLRDTPCALEGDADAVATLSELVRAAGGRPLHLDADRKPVYHAASVFASNYVVAALAAAVELYAAAGLSPDDRTQLAAHLARGTVDNVARFGPTAALTGPILRGDVRTVARHLDALAGEPQLVALYRALGLATADVAARRDDAPAAEALAEIRALLTDAAPP